jgi:hypothetical protein
MLTRQSGSYLFREFHTLHVPLAPSTPQVSCCLLKHSLRRYLCHLMHAHCICTCTAAAVDVIGAAIISLALESGKSLTSLVLSVQRSTGAEASELTIIVHQTLQCQATLLAGIECSTWLHEAEWDSLGRAGCVAPALGPATMGATIWSSRLAPCATNCTSAATVCEPG